MIQSPPPSSPPQEMAGIDGDYIVDNGPSMASFLMAGTNQGSDVSKLIMALMAHQKSESSETHSKEGSDDKKVNVTVNGSGESNDPYGLQSLSKGISSAASGLANIQGGNSGKEDSKKEPEAEKKPDDNAATPPPETPPAASEPPSEPPAAA